MFDNGAPQTRRSPDLPRRFPFVIISAIGTIVGGLIWTGSGATTAASLQQVTEIERQGFEDPAYPPPGWTALDALSGEGAPARLAWGRTDCGVDPEYGGTAAVWSARDGSVGQQLGCLDPYATEMGTLLRFGPIDTRPFPDGLRVNLDFRLDMPSTIAFDFCVRTPTENFGCFGVPVSEVGWTTFGTAPEFPDAGGTESVFVEFRYFDPIGSGEHFGVLLDNVVIEGLGGTAPTPTRTSVAQPTPTATLPPTGTMVPSPTVTATDRPSPTATPSPTETPQPSATPTRHPSPTGTIQASATPSSSATSTGTVEPTAEAPTATLTAEPSATRTSPSTDLPPPVETATQETPATGDWTIHLPVTLRQLR